MWICLHCVLKLVNMDKDELKKYYTPSLHNANCDMCKTKGITVDWIGEVDLKYLEDRNGRTQKPDSRNKRR